MYSSMERVFSQVDLWWTVPFSATVGPHVPAHGLSKPETNANAVEPNAFHGFQRDKLHLWYMAA